MVRHLVGRKCMRRAHYDHLQELDRDRERLRLAETPRLHLAGRSPPQGTNQLRFVLPQWAANTQPLPQAVAYRSVGSPAVQEVTNYSWMSKCRLTYRNRSFPLLYIMRIGTRAGRPRRPHLPRTLRAA